MNSKTNTERLQKVIAEAGIASRRAAEQLILAGKVTVNGATVTTLGTKVDPENDSISVDGKPVNPARARVVYLVNKPRGVVSSRKQQGNEPLVTDLVPSNPPVYPVGRLDKDSEGLILMTNDGTLTHQLTHPSFAHEREYLVEAKAGEAGAALDLEKICKRLQSGVKLSDGAAHADRVTATEKNGLLKLNIVVREGRHHLIRRMCAAVGLKVTRLTRLRIGILSLEKLSAGSFRKLTPRELKSLYDTFRRAS